MSTGAWIAAGAAVVVGGVIVLRSRTSSSSSSSPCDLATKYGIPKEACEGALGLLGDALDALSTDWHERETNNVALNGPAKKRIDPAMPRVAASTQFNPPLLSPAIYGTIQEHENGCQPFNGAPGWTKCAAGTQSQLLANGKLPNLRPLSGQVWGTGPSYNNVKGGDPFTLADRVNRTKAMPAAAADQAVTAPYPQPVPSGATAYWYLGDAFVCPQGTGIGGSTRDHRDGASPCMVQGEDGTYGGPLPTPVGELPPCPTRVTNGVTVCVRRHDGPQCRCPDDGPHGTVTVNSVPHGGA